MTTQSSGNGFIKEWNGWSPLFCRWTGAVHQKGHKKALLLDSYTCVVKRCIVLSLAVFPPPERIAFFCRLAERKNLANLFPNENKSSIRTAPDAFGRTTQRAVPCVRSPEREHIPANRPTRFIMSSVLVRAGSK